MGILSVLLWTPAIGAVLIAFVPSEKTKLVRTIANFVATLTLLVSCFVVAIYDQHDAKLQFTEFSVFNLKLGSAYSLGLDGISAPMLVLATLLAAIAILISSSIKIGIKSYHACVLMLEFGLLGVFLAQDWRIFYIFWELTLIPLFFLINRWGGARKHTASLGFVLYTMAGSVFMLLSLLATYQYVPEHNSSMGIISQAIVTIPKDKQLPILLGFLLGFGVKLPIFPLHGWLPLAHVEAPSPISILLSGILLKMGAYGLIRTVTMLPEAALVLQPLLVFLALFGMIYGGLLAWRQTDLKAMVAYSSISHMGVVLLGIASLNELGLQGAVLQMTAHGLTVGAMFLLVGFLYDRTHTRNIQDYSSIVQVMPRFAIFMTLTLFAAMGLPGSVGFIAELHTLIGGFQTWGLLMLFFSLSILISATYSIRTITLLFTGPVRQKMQHISDLHSYELLAAGILVSAILFFGLLPTPLIELSSATIADLLHRKSDNFTR